MTITLYLLSLILIFCLFAFVLKRPAKSAAVYTLATIVIYALFAMIDR
jgi:hypothetical protein